MTPALSAVIVAWNAGDTLTGLCRISQGVLEARGSGVASRDRRNASSDSAVESMPLAAGDIVIRNPVNAGYGVAVAQGFARRPPRGSWSANPDLVVDPWFVNALLAAAMQAAPEVATLVPELRFAARPDIVNCRGLTVDEVGVPAEVDAGTRVDSGAVATATILGGSSGCCLLRADHVRALGGAEPMFFAYLEDVDLALRLRCAGFETLFFVGEAVAFHEGVGLDRRPLAPQGIPRCAQPPAALPAARSAVPGATAWRAVLDTAHAGYLTPATPLAPWAGRAEALRFRRYTAFLRRARRRTEPCHADFDRAPRASLAATLQRKRSVIGEDG